MKTKLILGVIILITLIIIITQTNKTTEQLDNNLKAIKIGVILGQTGAASNWAEYAKLAADMAAKEINENGGVNGRKVELLYEDSQTTPKGSISAFQKLTDYNHVDAVMGDLWGFITDPLIPIAQSKKILTVSPTLMDRSVGGKSDYFYTLGHTVSSQEKSIHKFLTLHPEAKTVMLICWNDNWGKAHSELFRKVAEERNLKVIGEECNNDFGSDYRAIMLKVKSMNPDLLMITNSTQAPFKARYELGLHIPTLTTTTMVDALEAQKMPREYGLGIYLMDWKPSEEFIKKFQNEYNVYPILEAQNSYETIRSIAFALKKNENNPLLGIKEVSYESVDGKIDFTKGDHVTVNKAEAKLFKVVNKGYEEIK